MVAAVLSQYQVSPGRREEFIEGLGSLKTVLEGLGAKFQVRQTTIGGETAGRISTVSLFESAAARAAFIDRLTEQQPLPLQAVLEAADPPGTLLARSFLNEVNPQPDGDIPPASRVLAATSFRIAPGHSAEADAAFQAEKSLRESLGLQGTVWQLVMAGANSGLRVGTAGHESFSALTEGVARLQERNEGGPGPLARAVQSGTLELVNQAVSTLVEV